jgi:2-dehydropantoate 2-reductase
MLVITAILDLPMLAAAREPETRELMRGASQEALDAGVALGYPLLPIFGLTADEMGSVEGVVELVLDTLCAGFVLGVARCSATQAATCERVVKPSFARMCSM